MAIPRTVAEEAERQRRRYEGSTQQRLTRERNRLERARLESESTFRTAPAVASPIPGKQNLPTSVATPFLSMSGMPGSGAANYNPLANLRERGLAGPDVFSLSDLGVASPQVTVNQGEPSPSPSAGPSTNWLPWLLLLLVVSYYHSRR